MSQPWTPQRNEGGDTQDFRQDFLEMYRLRLQGEHPLGKMPLVVLTKTAGIDDDSDYTPDQLKWNRALQDQLAALSLNSEHRIASHSGHHIQLDEPGLVIESILKVVDAAGHHRPLLR